MSVAAVPINDAAQAATEAEEALIGAVMQTPAVWPLVEGVEPDDFSEPLHQRAWAAAAAIIRSGAEPNAALMWQALAGDLALQSLGGPVHLLHWIERAPTATAAASIASVVAANALRRRVQAALRPGLTPQEMRDALGVELERPDPVQDGRRLRASPYVPGAVSEIPTRQWLYGRHLLRGYVSATIAPGGLGKSSLVLADALAMVTRKALLGDAVHESQPLTVWYFNGEDDDEETIRRLGALRILHRIHDDEIGDRLYVDSGRTKPITLARETRDGFQLASVVEKQLEAEIRERRVDVLVLDPFVAVHEISENDNAKVNAVVRALARIAHRTGCAIELVHHVRKPGGGDTSETRVEDARGASSLIGAVRSARVLNVMSEDEAARVGVENRFQHFRVDNGKANMAARSDHAAWRRLVSIDLQNGHGHYPSDHVAAVEEWRIPGPFEGITVEQAMQMQRNVAQGDWRRDHQAANWVGAPIAMALGLDDHDPDARKRIRVLLDGWLKSGALKLVEKHDAKRNLRPHVEVGEWISAGDL